MAQETKVEETRCSLQTFERNRYFYGKPMTVSDFEAEGQLAHNNRVLANDVDTVFFMTAVEHGYVSSSLVKEIASFDGDVSAMIPATAVGPVIRALAARG